MLVTIHLKISIKNNSYILTIIGISTVSGNQVIDNMTRNTLKILDSIGFVSDTVKSQASEKNELDFDDCLTHGGLKIPVIEGINFKKKKYYSI